MAGSRLGRYDVIKTLAKGALTDLLLGRATGMEGFQRHVAIKLLHSEYASQPECFEAFVNEARLAAVLHHHNIVQVHDIGEDDGRPYFAMEYVHGVDLRRLLARLAKRNEQLPLQHVVAIIASVAAALHHAHEQRGPDGNALNIVHRDVSPANVLVGFDGNVKVADFGIAKAAMNQIHTDAGVLKGQAPYMSPEQCAGRPLDRRSDVFALGIVLFELATVRRLFKGANDFLTMSAICTAEVPKPSQYRRDIPPELEAIMLKALAPSPRERFYTAGDMSIALDNVASIVGVGASTNALAHYLRLQFGEQKEPWLSARPPTQDEEVDDFGEVTVVDFDGGASGLAPPPSEAVEKTALPRAISASKNSPIVAARTYALTPPTAMRKSPRPPSAMPMPLRAPTDSEPTEPLEAKPSVRPHPRASAVEEPLSAVITYPSAPRRSTRRPWILFAVLLVAGALAVMTSCPDIDLAGREPAAAAPSTEKHEPAANKGAPDRQPPKRTVKKPAVKTAVKKPPP